MTEGDCENRNFYADETNVRALIKYAGDDADDDLIDVALANADATVKSRLSQHNIPEPTDDLPLVLITAATYYAVSDILQSLYNGEERSGNEKGYYEKAESLLNDYIALQLDALATTALKFKSPYGVSQSPDPYQLGILRRY